MPSAELVAHGAHVMTVCNACRYCEQFCPVFPAMEQRLTFGKTDLTYLANLCHNCGECLYACQYAPPHEFGIDVPRTLARIRLMSYEEYAWPGFLGMAFRRHGVLSSVALAVLMTVVMWFAGNVSAVDRADFYAVVPHGVMVALFGGVFAFVLLALGIGIRRFARDTGVGQVLFFGSAVRSAIPDILTLRHLHASGADCVSDEETRSPWRRWAHHCTFYGFALCFASTSVAAVYHALGWQAPYAYTSVPVVLGTLGGVGLVVGPLSLWALRVRRDPALSDPDQRGLDEGFIVLLVLTSLTGLALMVLRDRTFMSLLLVVHLGTVLALFLSLPYGKFVHGLYHAVALVRYGQESRESSHA